MEFIKSEEAISGANSNECKTIEYSFRNKEMDLGLATITGRYPDKGYCENTVCKELVYVLEGSGDIYFEDRKISFSKGDAILIENNEKYYWETKYCKVSMVCTPAWSKEQYRLVEY